VKENLKIAYIVLSIVCIGIPLFFLIVSIFSGNWGFFYWSLFAAFMSGMPSGIQLLLDYHEKQKKKDQKK
jgi:ABC-type Fe3+ transport system permease subunit